LIKGFEEKRFAKLTFLVEGPHRSSALEELSMPHFLPQLESLILHIELGLGGEF
jgi:hypothetical protein